MSDELCREIDRHLHEIQHKIIREMVGDDLDLALYPECYAKPQSDKGPE